MEYKDIIERITAIVVFIGWYHKEILTLLIIQLVYYLKQLDKFESKCENYFLDKQQLEHFFKKILLNLFCGYIVILCACSGSIGQLNFGGAIVSAEIVRKSLFPEISESAEHYRNKYVFAIFFVEILQYLHCDLRII